MDSVQKARETRERNAAARLALCQEKAAATRAARLALTKVLECPDSTPGEVLEAARLLAELGKY